MSAPQVRREPTLFARGDALRPTDGTSGIRSGEPIRATAAFTRSGNRWKLAGR